jgi:hypothetical protein
MPKKKQSVARQTRRPYTARPRGSSSVVDRYSNMGLAGRVLLPFVVAAALFAIGFATIFSNRANGDSPKKQDVATIVFVEADVPAQGSDGSAKEDSTCSSAKADAVWKEAENLLNAYWTKAVGASNGGKWSLWMYALNGSPGAGQELVRIGPNELAEVSRAKGLTRKQREQDGWKRYAETAKAEYLKSFEPHPRQDIVSTIRFLLTNRHKFIGDDVGIVKLVYVSDMFHYNCDPSAVDPEAGYWNFLSLDAVERFQKQIDDGVLYHQDGEVTSINVPIEPLVDKKGDRTLEVYSVSIPRLPCERLPSQEVNRILATGQIEKTWERLFTRLNAKKVLLNVDSDRVFPAD